MSRTLDPLLAIFYDACKPRSAERLGVETEKFGILSDGSPLPYEGPSSIVEMFAQLTEKGWQSVRESDEGPVIALSRDQASITLEPGAQFELSGAPVDNVHQVCGEISDHLAEIAGPSERLGIRWLTCGYHPTATQDQLPWVPKQRYAIMREYFPEVGTRGLDMMRRTATAQVNVDYRSEEDALRKLRLGLKLAPALMGIFANSAFAEGKHLGVKCERARVWLDTDPDRTGLLPQLWHDGAGFRDYAEWALDAPMYLFKRDGKVVKNTGQTFRNFWQHGWQQHRATLDDWEMHLGTVFPEARLKRTIELRSIDSLPGKFVCAVPALWAGLLYDDASLASAEDLAAPWSYEQLQQLRSDAAKDGLAATIDGKPLRHHAEQLVSFARAGLERRQRLNARGKSEAIFLDSIAKLIEQGLSPADTFTL